MCVRISSLRRFQEGRESEEEPEAKADVFSVCKFFFSASLHPPFLRPPPRSPSHPTTLHPTPPPGMANASISADASSAAFRWLLTVGDGANLQREMTKEKGFIVMQRRNDFRKVMYYCNYRQAFVFYLVSKLTSKRNFRSLVYIVLHDTYVNMTGI